MDNCIRRKDAINTVSNIYNSCHECTLEEYRDTLIESFRVLCGVTPSVNDCISRQSTIVALANNRCGNDEWDLAVTHDVETVKRIPSVSPKHPTGYWTRRKTSQHNGELYCSACGKPALYSVYKNESYSEYCPHCGTEMCEVDPDEY